MRLEAGLYVQAAPIERHSARLVAVPIGGEQAWGRGKQLAVAGRLPSASALNTVPSCMPLRDRAFTENCQSDYESFTDSCLPADMNLGGRAQRLWVSLTDHHHGTTPR